MTAKTSRPATTLTESIASVVQQACKFWNTQNYRGLHDLWDPAETEPWYIAEDQEAPLIGWHAIEAYWQTSLGLAERDELAFTNLQTKSLGTDLAAAIYTLGYIRKIAGPGQTPEGEDRVSAIFRAHNNSWRFCHLAESPLSPVLSLRRRFDANTTEKPFVKSKKQ